MSLGHAIHQGKMPGVSIVGALAAVARLQGERGAGWLGALGSRTGTSRTDVVRTVSVHAVAVRTSGTAGGANPEKQMGRVWALGPVDQRGFTTTAREKTQKGETASTRMVGTLSRRVARASTLTLSIPREQRLSSGAHGYMCSRRAPCR
jgi:hypothetical protein